MSKIEDGGPAFPAQFFDDRATGTSLRDHYAGLAMQGLLARGIHYQTEGPRSARQGLDESDIAGHAYAMADAMLTARSKP